MKIILIRILVILNFTILVNSYGQKVIIDTDAAPDDLRAICMLLAREDINIVAITTSDGALDPLDGAKKVKELLQMVKRNDIPIGVGKYSSQRIPPFRTYASSFYWGDELPGEASESIQAEKLFNDIMAKADEVTFICLGPLTNIDQVIKSSSYKDKIEHIYWYSSYATPMQSTCFNYTRDSISAKQVIFAGIPMTIVNNQEKEKAVFDKELLDRICEKSNPYTNVLCKAFSNVDVQAGIKNGHHKIWDELVVLGFLYPEYFTFHAISGDYPVSKVKDYEICKAREAIIRLLGHDPEHKYVVFEDFPHNPEMFREDIAPYVDEIIAKHGEDEWRACLLTNEIHGHLGIYSLAGAKMGIRAREYFNVGLDKLEVVSYTGNHPPISCMNDGLQISTGATLGQGTISIVTDSIPKPEAIFKYGSKQIKMSIKPEYRKKFKSDIESALLQYDLSQAGYWQLVRELAIRYWLELDRNEMFIIEEIK